jgi:DNA-binding response OmpR family regulator
MAEMELAGTILFLEDDMLLGESIQDFLEEEGLEVVLCRNGQEALDYCYEQHFDLYLLDINVPLLNGLELLHDLRQAEDTTPAIFLTSHTEKSVMLDGFARGADDYMKKPVDLDELLARVAVLLRRSKGDGVIRAGELTLDEHHKSVVLRDRRIELTAKEYALMALLIRHAEKVVTKEMIMDELWSASESVSDGALRVYINRLKSEVGPEKIENVRGVGYRLVP